MWTSAQINAEEICRTFLVQESVARDSVFDLEWVLTTSEIAFDKPKKRNLLIRNLQLRVNICILHGKMTSIGAYRANEKGRKTLESVFFPLFLRARQTQSVLFPLYRAEH